MIRLLFAVLLSSALWASGCGSRTPDARQYELTGQVLAVRPDQGEIVIRHGDIKGFMPGMTMPFKIKDRRLLEHARAGEIVTATLVVEDADAWLSRITATGERAPLPAAEAPTAMPPVLQPGDPVPEETFIAQDGGPLATSTLRGAPWALTFIYTRCPLPTFCPALDRRFQAVQRGIAADAALAGAHLVSISFDPAFDTPEVLRVHAGRLEADPAVWRFVTGTPEAVDRFGARFGLMVQRGGGAPEDFVHSLRTAVVDRQGRLVRVFEGAEWTAQDVLAALRGAVR